MKSLKLMITIIAMFILVLTACSKADDQPANTTKPATTNQPAATDNSAATAEPEPEQPATVEITDLHGKVTVPVNPKTVVSLDSRTFETLASWGIKLAAAPKAVMPPDSPYVSDESVADIGNHREPNLELLASVEPDLVIIGQRFAGFYEDIKKLVPNAVVIDLNFDVSTKAETPGANLVNGLKDATTNLGKIFEKNDEANALIAAFDKVVAEAQNGYNGQDTIMSVVVSAGNIGFSAPHSGRVWGPMYEIFNWVPALEVDNSSSDHQGDEISVEAIAQSNPDWILVLDRDASTSSGGDSVPAKDVIDNSPALKNTTAIMKGQIIYAPSDTYTNESIETYLELFDDLAKRIVK